MSNKAIAASVLAGAWVGIATLALAQFLPAPEWPGPRLLGVSCSFLLFRVVAWGLLPALLPRLSLWGVGAVALGLDLVVVGTSPLGGVGGEIVSLMLAFAPAQLFNRWTRERSHLRERVALHFVYYTALLLWVVPAVVLELTGGSFAIGPLTRLDQVFLQIIALPGILGMAATLEFRDRGQGTPMPYDPPRTLVTTGPYAYVANPFQIAKVLLLLGWGLFLRSGWVVAACGVVFLYGISFARWKENRDAQERFGAAWDDYRFHVRRWIPRRRPWRNPAHPPAKFYFDGECNQCRQLAILLTAASHLELVPATRELRRMTYDPRDGSAAEEGVAALARALEHLHLGWAFIGWSLRVPFLQSLFQLIADVVTARPANPTPACQLDRRIESR